jgi:hypothetical protein
MPMAAEVNQYSRRLDAVVTTSTNKLADTHPETLLRPYRGGERGTSLPRTCASRRLRRRDASPVATVLRPFGPSGRTSNESTGPCPNGLTGRNASPAPLAVKTRTCQPVFAPTGRRIVATGGAQDRRQAIRSATRGNEHFIPAPAGSEEAFRPAFPRSCLRRCCDRCRWPVPAPSPGKGTSLSRHRARGAWNRGRRISADSIDQAPNLTVVNSGLGTRAHAKRDRVEARTVGAIDRQSCCDCDDSDGGIEL